MTDATMTTIDVAALNVLADWFDKLPDGGMGKEHFDGLVIVVSELLSRAVAPAPARPANAELVERLCSSVQALIAALPPNPAEGLFLQAEATAEQCRRTLAAMLSASPSPPALDGAGREGWQPIETAPKDGTRVLLWANSGYVFSGYWSHDEDEPEEDCWSDDGDNWWEPHHWMPLPTPPKETR